MIILKETDGVTMFLDSAGDYYCAYHIAPGASEIYPLMLGPEEFVDYDEIPW